MYTLLPTKWVTSYVGTKLRISASVMYAVPKLESASIFHEIISKCKYICLRMTSVIQAKVACAKSISLPA